MTKDEAIQLLRDRGLMPPCGYSPVYVAFRTYLKGLR